MRKVEATAHFLVDLFPEICGSNISLLKAERIVIFVNSSGRCEEESLGQNLIPDRYGTWSVRG